MLVRRGLRGLSVRSLARTCSRSVSRCSADIGSDERSRSSIRERNLVCAATKRKRNAECDVKCALPSALPSAPPFAPLVLSALSALSAPPSPRRTSFDELVDAGERRSQDAGSTSGGRGPSETAVAAMQPSASGRLTPPGTSVAVAVVC